MHIDACFQLGYIVGTHGLLGEVHAVLDTDRPDNYQDLESVLVLRKKENTLIPFFIDSLKIKGDKAIIKFEELSSKDEALLLKGSTLYLPLDLLPPLEGDDFYYHELVNWTVRDKNLGKLGPIRWINHQSPQVLLVMDYQDHEVLIPFTDEVVLGIDRDLKEVSVLLPDGLLDIYLKD